MGKKSTKGNLKKVGEVKAKPKLSILPPLEIPLWIIAIIFLFTTLLFFWDQIFGNAYFWEDITELWYPFQTFAAKTFAKGFIPFWNPYIFSGMPFVADIEVGFFYPLNRILTLFVDSNGHLSIFAVELAIIVHFFIAQLSMYLLARYWKISSFGAIIAAVSFSFSLILVCHVIHPMMLYHFVWFPLVLMFFIKGISERRIKYAILSAWFFGISMLAGHPQSTLFETMFLGLVFIWYFIYIFKEKLPLKSEGMKKDNKGVDISKFILCGIIPFIVAIGIFSIELMPSRELAANAQRQEINFDKASQGSLQVKQVFTTIVPKLFGFVDGENFKSKDFTFYLEGEQYYEYWETAFYFGLVALLLGFLGIYKNYKTKEGILLIIILCFSFFYSLGKNFFIFEMFFKLPLFEYFRMPARMMYYFVLAFAIFAGFGFDYLWEKVREAKTIRILIIISAIPVIIALMTTFGIMQGIMETPAVYANSVKAFGALAFFIIALTIIISLLINRQKISPNTGGILLIVIATVDLFLAGTSFNKNSENPEKAYELNPQTKEVFAAKPPQSLFRVSIRLYQEGVIAMARNQGMMDDIMTTDGYNPLVLLRGGVPAPNLREAHDLSNVKYAILKDTVGGGFRFFEYHPYNQRAWISHKYKLLNSDSVLNFMLKTPYDYANEIILEEKPDLALSGNPPDTLTDNCECLTFQNNGFIYKVSTKQNALVFFSEIWYPAWKAYIDGKPAKIYRADYCFRAVEVTPGEHTIEMRYESKTFAQGFAISSITILASIIAFVYAMFREKKKKKE